MPPSTLPNSRRLSWTLFSAAMLPSTPPDADSRQGARHDTKIDSGDEFERPTHAASFPGSAHAAGTKPGSAAYSTAHPPSHLVLRAVGNNRGSLGRWTFAPHPEGADRPEVPKMVA